MATAVATSLSAVTPSRHEAFLGFLEGEAKGNAAEAARLAGYAFPKVEGPKLARRYAGELARRASERKAKARVSEDEALEVLAQVIRDPGHKDRMKALELQLRVDGKLSDKAQVEESKSNLVRELRMLLDSHAKHVKGAAKGVLTPPAHSPQIIEAELVQTHESPPPDEQAGSEDASG